MRLGHLAATASALMLIASPALAATANPASKLSVASSVRAGSKLKDSSNVAPVVVVVAVVAALVGLGFATGVFDDDDDSDSN